MIERREERGTEGKAPVFLSFFIIYSSA